MVKTEGPIDMSKASLSVEIKSDGYINYNLDGTEAQLADMISCLAARLIVDSSMSNDDARKTLIEDIDSRIEEMEQKAQNTIVLKENDGDYYGEITDELNSHLKESPKRVLDKKYTFGTYICKPDTLEDSEDKIWSIRYPGATRGHIVTNKDNEIIDIMIMNLKLVRDLRQQH